MALSTNARQRLMANLGSSAGIEFADVIDANGGTLAPVTRTKLQYAMADVPMANRFITMVEAGTAMDANMVQRLSVACNSLDVAIEVRDELAA